MNRSTRISAGISRRNAITLAAAATALPLVHMQTANAAGSLKLALWDHWVPATKPVMQKLVAEWGTKNHVIIALDFLEAQLPLTQAAEALSGTGHDVMTFFSWDVQHYHQHLEPIDDIMAAQIRKYGAIDPVAAYLAKVGGHWVAMPTSVGSQYKAPAARISWFKKQGYNVQEWYPAHPGNAKTAEPWTYELMLELAPAAKKDGLPFGLGLSQIDDSVEWTGALLRANGAVLADEKGNSLLNTEPVMRMLEFVYKLYPFLPADTAVYNNASNNKALISGESALIFNPPSAWWVARRDAIKVAEDCWHFPSPAGPKGRYIPYEPWFWGVWSFSQNKSAAKELITWLQERPQVETLTNASDGYDIPPLQSMHDFEIWSKVEPPPGVVYNYPIRPWHDAQSSIACWPAPPRLATQMYNKGLFNTMVIKMARGAKMKEAIAWGEEQIESYVKL